MDNQMTNYRTMKEPELLDAMGIDAQKWAEAFCQCTLFQDRDLAETWLANAIMAGYQNTRSYGRWRDGQMTMLNKHTEGGEKMSNKLETAESINHQSGIGAHSFKENPLLELGADTQKLALQTLNYIKQHAGIGEKKKGIVIGRMQEIDRMIKHLQSEQINLQRSLHALGEKYD